MQYEVLCLDSTLLVRTQVQLERPKFNELVIRILFSPSDRETFAANEVNPATATTTPDIYLMELEMSMRPG